MMAPGDGGWSRSLSSHPRVHRLGGYRPDLLQEAKTGSPATDVDVIVDRRIRPNGCARRARVGRVAVKDRRAAPPR